MRDLNTVPISELFEDYYSPIDVAVEVYMAVKQADLELVKSITNKLSTSLTVNEIADYIDFITIPTYISCLQDPNVSYSPN
jgi:hypothetical protein